MKPDASPLLPSSCPSVPVPNHGAKAEEPAHWFVMRDLKRPNAKRPAYKTLSDGHFEVFTPMKWKLATVQGKRIRKEVPVIQDLLFVHTRREDLDPVVETDSTLQYRYLKGGGCRNPMTVPAKEMERFMRAAKASDSPRYYLPEELTPSMAGREVRIIGGPLDGYEGRLMTVRGSKARRLLVELPNLLAVAVEVNPEYIQFL